MSDLIASAILAPGPVPGQSESPPARVAKPQTRVSQHARRYYSVVELAKKEGLPLEPFTVHDLRRTGSTLLNELGFNSDWIEKCLAHEDGRSPRGVYNKAEYEVQRRHMMQEWSDIIDPWVAGEEARPHAHTAFDAAA